MVDGARSLLHVFAVGSPLSPSQLDLKMYFDINR